jgi:hypothetical protein
LSEHPHYRDVFIREAKLLATMDHPHVIPLFDYCESKDGPVLITKLIEKAEDSVPLRKVAVQIASALDYCADRGFAHRDVKPDNILVGNRGDAYLADFELAAKIDDEKNWSQAIGALAYLCPEMLGPRSTRFRPEDRKKCDQFSLGVTLYHLLTGKLPHDRRERDEEKFAPEYLDCTAARLLLGQMPVPPHGRNPVIPSAVEGVLLRMLSVDPDDRYPSNLGAAQDFERALSGHTNNPVKIFISYSRSEKPFVSQLADQLGGLGHRVWYDQHLVCGRPWDDQIEEKMIDSQVMLVVLSPDAARSQEVKNEWSYWLDFLKKPLITLKSTKCAIPYRLSTKHWLPLDGRTVETVAVEISREIERLLSRSAEDTVMRSRTGGHESEGIPPDQIAASVLGSPERADSYYSPVGDACEPTAPPDPTVRPTSGSISLGDLAHAPKLYQSDLNREFRYAKHIDYMPSLYKHAGANLPALFPPAGAPTTMEDSAASGQ